MAIFGLGSARFEVQESFSTNAIFQAITSSSTTPEVLEIIKV